MPTQSKVFRDSRAIAALCLLLLSAGVAAQAVNPLANDPRAASAGGTLFRAQCATCHGADARGIESIDAPDLTLLWQRDGVTDGSVFATIREGIPGTIMPPHGFPDPQVWMLVSYLRSVNAGDTVALPAGDGDSGRRLFARHCAECHRAGSGGSGSLGPALGGLPERRSLESLIQSVREPSAAIGRGYQPVSLVTASGEAVSGVLKGEDAFSLQLLDTNQRLRAFMKADLQRLTYAQGSLMPAFPESLLSTQQLIDIFQYLQSPDAP